MVSDDDDDVVLPVQPQQQAGPSQAVIIRQAVPPYGQRKGWKPTSLEDLGAFDRFLIGVRRSDWSGRGWWGVPRMPCRAIPLEHGQEEGELPANSYIGYGS